MNGHAECAEACPHYEKIEAVYEKVVTGNGDAPIPEKVRKLENEMATVLPILNDLKTAADRQDGRDAQRLQDEVKRDKAWANFRRNITLIVLLGMLALAGATFYKQLHATLTNIPQIFPLHNRGQVYSASSRRLMDAGSTLAPHF